MSLSFTVSTTAADRVTCPQCRASLKMPAAKPGAMVQCPRCATAFRIRIEEKTGRYEAH